VAYLSAILWRENVTSLWDDSDVCFVLDQISCSCIVLAQWHNSPRVLGQILMTPR